MEKHSELRMGFMAEETTTKGPEPWLGWVPSPSEFLEGSLPLRSMRSLRFNPKGGDRLKSGLGRLALG